VKTVVIFAVFILISRALVAQLADSLEADTLILDSIKACQHSIDSLRQNFNSGVQALNTEYQASIGYFDIQTLNLNHRIDSLQKLNLPTSKLTAKADSLSNLRFKKLEELNNKASSLKSKTIAKLSEIELTPGMEGPAAELTQKINGFDLVNNPYTQIPSLDIPGYSLPEMNGLSDLTEKIPSLSDIETPLGDAEEFSGQLNGISDDVKNITEGKLADVEHVPDAIEKQAANIEGVKELQKQSGIADDYAEQITGLNDPGAVKKHAAELAKKELVNHFSGKEEQLKAAMDKVSKYKQKYSSASSLKELSKRPPNAMKGKPFIERLVPGIYFQYQRKNAYLLDVNPYTGYRISGRFTAGIGWNHRLACDKKDKDWLKRSVIFGPRAFLDAKLGRGFVAHVEQETMNTFIPSTIHLNPEDGEREWVWSTMVGMKKEYRIYKNLMGTVLLQYNLFNRYYKAPYVDRLNSRIGFEYKLRKKKK
jgi:hypothetical protein